MTAVAAPEPGPLPLAPAAPAAGPWAGHVLALVALTGFLLGVHLWHPGLLDPDEPRTAMVARLMAERGDWLAPHLPAVFHHDYPHDPAEGDLFAYWDKPPLYFWLAGAAMKVLGPTALAARLPAALGYLAAVLLVYAAGRSLWGGRAGLLAGAVMATAPLPLVMAHVARIDSLMVALMAAMLLAILRLGGGTARPWTWTLVLYIAAGLGLLAKGPTALVFPAAAVGVTVVLTGRWRDVWRLRPIVGAVICLAIAVPWYAYMHWRYPAAADGSSGGFLYEFFVRQHFARATTGEFGHTDRVPGYLVAVLLGGLVPWTVFLPAALGRLAAGGWRDRRDRPAIVLLLAWPVLVLAAFSVSKTQLEHYVLPAFPPLAVFLGAYLADRVASPGRDRLFTVGLWITILSGAAVVTAIVVCLVRAGLWHPAHVAAVAAIAVILAGGIIAIRKQRRAASLALLVAGTAAITAYAFVADPFGIYHVFTTHREAAILTRELRPGDRVLAFPYTPYSLAWYLWPRDVPYPAEGTGLAAEPSVPQLIEELNKPVRTFCVLQKKAAVEVIQRDVRWPVRVLSRAKQHTLIVVEPPATAAEKSP